MSLIALIFTDTELFDKLVGNVSLYMDFAIKQILFIAQLYMYWTIYNATKENNEKAHKMISKSSLKMRYRLNSINMTGEIVRFITDTILILITLGFVLLSKIIGIDYYHVIIVGNVCNVIQSITLFFSCHQLTRTYLGEHDKWMPKCILKLFDPEI